MRKFLLLAALCCAQTQTRAEDNTPVPPELRALGDAFMAAFTTGDASAMTACWHAPATLAKARQEEAAAQTTATSPTEVTPAKEHDRELKRQEKNLAVTLARATELRSIITQHFGPLEGLKMDHLELDEDEESSLEKPAYDGVEIHCTSVDGSHLIIHIDDALKLNGQWKFKGRLEDEFTVEIRIKED